MILNNEKDIWNFFDNLRSNVPFYGFASFCVRLLFMKFMFQFEETSKKEDFKTLVQYMNMFASKKIDQDALAKTMEIAEKYYATPKGCLREAFLNEKEFLDCFDKNSSKLFDILNSIELPTDKESIDLLFNLIFSFSNNSDVSRTVLNTTNESVLSLANRILDVKPTETFLDAYCGYFSSSLKINAKKYVGYEINPLTASIAVMVQILSGNEDFEIYIQDFIQQGAEYKCDKFFADGPLGMNVSDSQKSPYGRRSEVYSLLRGADAKRAVVLVPSVILTSADSLKKLRESFTATHLVAVIALPPLWAPYTGINMNIVVLEKEKKSNDVIFINTSDNSFAVRPDKKSYMLKEDTISKIMDALEGNIDNVISKRVKDDDVLKSESVSWAPQHYIKTESKVEFRSIAEIDKELKLVNEQLRQYIKFSDGDESKKFEDAITHYNEHLMMLEKRNEELQCRIKDMETKYLYTQELCAKKTAELKEAESRFNLMQKDLAAKEQNLHLLEEELKKKKSLS